MKKTFRTKVIAIVSCFALVMSLMTGISFVNANAGVSLSSDKETYCLDEPMMVTADSDDSGAWVGLHDYHATNTNSYWWYYISDYKNTPVDIFTTEKQYEISDWIDFDNGGSYTLAIHESSGITATKDITIEPVTMNVSLDREDKTYTEGQPINVTASSNACKAWLGVFDMTDPAPLDTFGFGGYYFKDAAGTENVLDYISGGLPAGQYRVVACYSGQHVAAIKTFTVVEETTTEEVTTAEETTVAPEPTTVAPEPTTNPYADLDYKDITNNQNPEFDQTLKGSQYAVASGPQDTLSPCQFQNAGFSELYIAGGGWSADQLSATINGKANSVTIEGAGLRCLNCADYLDRKYNEIDVSWNGGTAKIIIYCPLKTDPETTTVDPTAPTTETPETTTADPWKKVANTDDYYYNEQTKSSGLNVVNYQTAGENTGIYMNVPAGISSVRVNGVEETQIQGAGFWVALDKLTYAVNDVEVVAGSTYTVQVKNTASNIYDVEEYKSTTPASYPTKEGKVFAGWYEDPDFDTPYTATTGYAYAKFIDEAVLGPVKFQKATDGTAIRFLSSVDCADYESAGFIINGSYDGHSITNKSRAAKKLYSAVKAGGETVYPTIFSPESNYFFTYTVDGLESGKTMSWNITPYFVTADGTTVTGAAGTYPQS